MSKIIILTLLFLGVCCILISVAQNEKICPKQKIIYRYIPRTFEEEQNDPVYISDIFATMFSQPSQWSVGMGQIGETKSQSLEKYYISQ